MMDSNMILQSSKGAAIAGFIGGLLGLGGGVILTPLWLKMGFPNMRTSATSTFTVVFTSFSSLFSNLLAGRYSFMELIFWSSLSFIFSYFVSRILKYLVRKYKKESIILVVLLFIITLAGIVLPIQGLFRMIEKPTRIYTFGTFC